MVIDHYKANNMENNKIEKRHYRDKKQSDIVNFPILLRRDFLSPKSNREALDAPVSSLRIMFKILNDVSHDQFRQSNNKQLQQLSLFEDDFKTEHNTYARFTFKISSVAGKRDYNNVKRGLEFLENWQKGWYKSVNAKGKPIKSYGGFITNANISEGQISFLMSSYWFEKVVMIEKYNTAFAEVAWKFTKSKQILFYLWLLELPDKGTKVNFQTFQEVYDYHYKDATTYAKNVLKSLKRKLDKFSNRSFNYSVKGDNISIMPYYTKDTELPLKKETSKKQVVVQKLNYWKQRHNLDKNNIDVLKSLINIDYGNFKLFKNAYQNIIVSYRELRKPVTDLQGDDFIKMFQAEIILVYQNSAWGNIAKNAYPIIE